ncbi:MAG: sarcosine oxidase subunit gamma family protein [Pseudomonadota bacterium]
MTTLARRSPLGAIRGDVQSARVIQQDGLTVRELPFGVHRILRFERAAVTVSDAPLPERINRAVVGAYGLLAWVGPDEWWLWSGDRSSGDDPFARVPQVDVSHGHTALEVSGEGARSVLARGIPLDLHPRAFGAGFATRTHVDHAPVLMIHTDADSTFYLVVRRSFAHYLWQWLEMAAERRNFAPIP